MSFKCCYECGGAIINYFNISLSLFSRRPFNAASARCYYKKNIGKRELNLWLCFDIKEKFEGHRWRRGEGEGRQKDTITVKQWRLPPLEVHFVLKSAEKNEDGKGEEMTRKYYDHCQPDRQLMVHTYYGCWMAALLSLRVERHLLEFFSEVDNFFPSFPFVASWDIYHISSAFRRLPRLGTFFLALSFIYSLMLCVLHLSFESEVRWESKS